MSIYKELKRIKEEYPELTFDNDGYEYLSKAVKEAHKEQIDLLHKLLKSEIEGFVRFDNFKPREEQQTFDVRVQYYYDKSFVGVGYVNIELFK